MRALLEEGLKARTAYSTVLLCSLIMMTRDFLLSLKAAANCLTWIPSKLMMKAVEIRSTAALYGAVTSTVYPPFMTVYGATILTTVCVLPVPGGPIKARKPLGIADAF